ncbi:MAG: hypothetical protein O3A13_00665 [Proteobacteria bacterium]|nr:hypothetical protein [Pseudomonadota bacterium]MDA0992123.1 hypothetical protein [Pseudomonadota bacterium]
MKKRFIQLTSGWIPVSVLLLFTVALIAGQARANLPGDLRAEPVPAATSTIDDVTGVKLRWSPETLPLIVESLPVLPYGFEIAIDGRHIFLNEPERQSQRSAPKSQ